MSTWYHLFDGDLTDAPGRCESWTEEVCYLAKNKWLLRTRGTDFSGMEEGETHTEDKTSKSLVDWLGELDGYDQESQSSAPFYDSFQSELLGERLKRLKLLSAIVDDHQVYRHICSIEQRRFMDLRGEFWAIDELMVEELEPLTKKQLPVETTLLDSLNEIIGKLVEVQIFEIATRESKFDKYYLKKIIPSNYFDGDGAYYAWCKSNDLYGETLRAFIQNHVIEHHKLPTGVHIVPFNGDEVSIGIVDFDWLHELCQLDSP